VLPAEPAPAHGEASGRTAAVERDSDAPRESGAPALDATEDHERDQHDQQEAQHAARCVAPVSAVRGTQGGRRSREGRGRSGVRCRACLSLSQVPADGLAGRLRALPGGSRGPDRTPQSQVLEQPADRHVELDVRYIRARGDLAAHSVEQACRGPQRRGTTSSHSGPLRHRRRCELSWRVTRGARASAHAPDAGTVNGGPRSGSISTRKVPSSRRPLMVRRCRARHRLHHDTHRARYHRPPRILAADRPCSLLCVPHGTATQGGGRASPSRPPPAPLGNRPPDRPTPPSKVRLARTTAGASGRPGRRAGPEPRATSRAKWRSTAIQLRVPLPARPVQGKASSRRGTAPRYTESSPISS
jgi:hypothetical protein